MSTTEQKALELADRLQQDFNSEYINWDNIIEAAAELRRLSTENEALRAQADADNLRHLNHTRMIKGYQDELTGLRAQVEALTKLAEPAWDTTKLAEMVLSDCGCSSNHTRLLERVACRIEAHVQNRITRLVALTRPAVPESSISADQVKQWLRDAASAESWQWNEQEHGWIRKLIASVAQPEAQAKAREQHDADSRELRSLCSARDEARRQRDMLTVENAALQSSIGHLSRALDEQRQLLVDVERECGTDNYGMPYEDGDSKIIDRVRAHLDMHAAAPQPLMDPERQHDAVAAAHAKRLALELECLLLDTKDTAKLSKWWESALQALDQYQADLRQVESAAPHP